jgi:hypothetical protein
MRLPRRVPWASIAELDEVCTYIYSSDADDRSKRAAVNRVSYGYWIFDATKIQSMDSSPRGAYPRLFLMLWNLLGSF